MLKKEEFVRVISPLGLGFKQTPVARGKTFVNK